MKIIIAGGTGHVGAVLRRGLTKSGREVVVLSRRPRPLPGADRVVRWDGETLDDWTKEIDGADVVINLAGRSVDCRYHGRNLAEMMASRLNSTTVIGRAIALAGRPPKIWLQAGTATIYAHRYDAPNDEINGIIGGDEPDAPAKWTTSIAIARAWEEATLRIPTPDTRKVILRSAMTMSPDRGSVFDVLSTLVRLGAGGTIGDGRQFVSWIHEDDFVRAIEWLLGHDDLSGPVNLCAPHPLPNREFMAALRAAWGTKLGLPSYRPLLEIGCWLLRTESELVLKSRRGVPKLLTDSGFTFKFPDWDRAAIDLVNRRTGCGNLPHRDLVKSLRTAYSAEKAAAFAYVGHAASLGGSDAAKRVNEIEHDEWDHRRHVGEIMTRYGIKPSRWLELKYHVIGKVISASCHVIGRFLPYFFAGKLESGNVCEYFVMMRHFRSLGITEHDDLLYAMGVKEKEHEDYFLGLVKDEPWFPWFERVFNWGPTRSRNDVDLADLKPANEATLYCRHDNRGK